MLCWLLVGSIGCLDGGPHPEPPDPLGPPADRLDSGVDLDNSSDEGVVMGPPGAGAGGAAGSADAGGSGGAGGDHVPTACTDASVEGGWGDEDGGALR